MFLFCLALQPCLRQLQALHPTCRFLAIADDVTITGPTAAAVVSAFYDAKKLMGDIGLTSVGKKCRTFGCTDFSAELGFLEIEVCRRENGAPFIVLHGPAEEFARERGAQKIHLSLSHTAGCAVAQVVIEGAPK